MKRFLMITATLATCLPLMAQAEVVCMETEELAASLKDWYGEVPVKTNAATGQQIWASERNGTWTLVSHKDTGVSCTLESGTNYSAALLDNGSVAGLLEEFTTTSF